MSHRLAPGLAAVLLSASIIAVAAPARAHSQAERHASSAAAAMLGGDPTGAAADPRGAEDRPWSITSGAPAPTLPGAVAAFAVLLLVLGAARRPRSSVVAIAVLALVVLAFQGGLHSVHHLGDEHGASQCSVASASSHLAGTTAEPPSVEVSALPSAEPCHVSDCSALPRTPARPDAGRAPPPPRAA